MSRTIAKQKGIGERLLLIGIALAAVFWMIDAAIQVFIFQHGKIMQQISTPSAHEFWIRSFVGATFVVFALYAQSIVNKRRQAEKATRLAYSELDQIFETAAGGMRVIDKNFNILRVNGAFSTLSGEITQRVLGEKCYKVFGGHECHTPSCPLTRILRGEEHVEYDADKMRNDGGVVHCMVTARPLCGPDGELIGMVENFKDIRHRRQWEERLRESEMQKRTILDASVDMIMQLDEEMRIVWANKIAVEAVNRRLEDLMGHTCYHVLKYGRVPCPGCPCKKAFETGGVEHAIMHHDAMSVVGESYWEDYGVPLKNESNEITGVIMIARNVTEEKKAEQALIRAKEDWENTFDSIADVVMLLDSKHRIMRVNRAGVQAFSTAEEGLIGKKCYEVIHRQSHCIEGCPLELTMTTLRSHTAEIMEPNLGEGPFICSVSPMLDGDRRLTGFTQSLKDISESKRLEAQLQQAQRMEAIGTLAGGIAHDFNNLLMGLQGNVSLMLMDRNVTDPDYRQLRTIENQIRSGGRLASRLLGCARKGKYEVKPVDLNRLVQETCETFGRTRKDIIIHQELSDDLGSPEADSGQIEQVLLNLFVNAGDAMPSGGNLTIKTANTTHTAIRGGYRPPPGDYVLLSVTDTGAGMDEKTITRIFDPFFTTKGIGRGTGLGLASAYGIIKAHGGYIDVESKEGQGSKFTIYMPSSGKELERTEKKTVLRFMQGRERVLLVDDEEEVLRASQECLERMGYGVLTAKDGKEAVQLYRKHQECIDIVVLDMVMPTTGGGEAYDSMKEINKDVKVLLASGYSIDGEAGEILERGCNGFIQKPFNFEELSVKIREILEGEEDSLEVSAHRRITDSWMGTT